MMSLEEVLSGDKPRDSNRLTESLQERRAFIPFWIAGASGSGFKMR
jgi:hypothetical protein